MSPFFLLLTVASQTAAPSTIEIPFRTVAFGKNSRVKDGGIIVIRSAKQLDAYRKKMKSLDEKRPAIAWGKEQVVAIHAVGTGFGSMSLQVVKIIRKQERSLEVLASIDPGSAPASPTPGVMMVLKKEGLYTLVVVPTSRGEVMLRIVVPPSSSGDRNGMPGSR